MSDPAWLATCFRQGFKNLGGGALTRFDARALARGWKEDGAELVFMNAIHGGELLYASRLGSMSDHLKGRDLVGELVDECRRLGIRSGAYISPLQHQPFLREHPGWRQTQTDGSYHGRRSGYYEGCWNSEYLDRFCELVSELFRLHPLDAVFFDGLVSRHGVCHCSACEAKFRADTGFVLPGAHDLADPAFRAYLPWKEQTLAEACRRLVEATRVVNPGVQAVSNSPAAWCNWCAAHSPEFYDAAECVCVEVFPGFGGTLSSPGTLHYPGIACMAYNMAYTRGQARGFPKLQAYNYTGPLNFSIDHDVLIEAQASIAMGGLSCIQGDRPATRDAFAYIRRCEPYLTGTRPLLWAGLAASQESGNTQFVQDAVSGAYFEDLRGTFGALLDNKVPVEFISGRDLAETPLDPYAVLILSDTGYLHAKQVAALRDFVQSGGGLVVTARSGLIGEDGKALPDFGLADVFGVHAAPAPQWPGENTPFGDGVSACLAFEESPWWGDAVQPAFSVSAGDMARGETPWFGSSLAHPVLSPFQAVSAAPDAEVVAWMRPLRSGIQERFPGIVLSRHGKGRVVYLAPRLGEIYARYPFPVWRRILERAVREATATPPPVEVLAPLSVTLYVWEQAAENRWIIHLINDLDQTGRPRGRMAEGTNPLYGSQPREGAIPVEGVELLVRRPGSRLAELPLENRTLGMTREADGALRIRVGRLVQHAMVVVS